MRRIILTIVASFLVFGFTGCSDKEMEPYVVNTYSRNLSEADIDEVHIFTTFYEMSDGTWRTDEHTYQYKLEITGRLNNAVKDSTYIILSNTENITFEQAWKASGLSSLTTDYFDIEETIIVGMG